MYKTSRFLAVAKGAYSTFLMCLSFTNVLATDRSIREGNTAPLPPSFSSQSDPSRNFEGDRGTRVCGSNALYMLLGLYNIPVDQDQFVASVPVNDDGTSLAELREASAALGLETVVRRCTIEELQRNFQAPFLAHLAMTAPHYTVVIDISDDSVTFLDGTTGQIETLKRLWVEKRWSGYVLLPRTSATFSPILLGASMFNCLLVCFLLTKLYGDSQHRPHIRRDS